MGSDRMGVLVVVNGRSLRKELRENLEGCAFMVCEACGATDGLQTIDGGFRPHIVVTDMRDSDLDDFTLAAEQRSGRPIRVIALANLAQLADMEEAFVGPFDYILFEDAVSGLSRGVSPMGA